MEEGAKPGAATPGAATPAQAGRRFGRYQLLEAVDRGGMAEVYRAVSQGPGGFQRQFVIKRIRKEKAGSRDFVEMFVNEARISALLEHPNIVQVYDFGQVDGDYFLAMEYLRGRNLQQVSRRLRKQRQSLPPDLVAYVGREVARGLHYAHTLSNMGEPLNIVHRDVSPSNIMLLRTGGVKLLDFGIARATMKLRSLTPIGGMIKGKLSYLSPEQVRGQGVDGRSDVFSLGVVLWEALTGLRLFFHPVELETMRNVLHRPVPKPSELRADVPAGLEAIVMRALERDVDKRFPDAGAMAAALEDRLREARFSPETVVRLLGELFGDEDSGRELPLPDEAALVRRPSGQHHPAISSGSLPPMAPLPAPAEEDQGYATVSEVHRLAELATRHRRKRYIQVGAGTLALAAVGLFALSFTTRAPEKPAAPLAAIAPAINVPAAVATAETTAAASAPATPDTIGPETPVPPPPPAMAPEVTPLPPPASKRIRAFDDDGDSEHTPTQTTRSRRATPPPPTAPVAPAPAPASQARGKRSLSIGLAALESGEYLRAATQLEEALEASPNSPEALAGLAEAEFELAHYAKAVFHAHKAASLAPRNPRYQALLADSLFKLRRYRDAAAAYAQAAALAPNEASLRDRKARAEGLIGSRDEAKSSDNDGE